jgi:hypothetical protein
MSEVEKTKKKSVPKVVKDLAWNKWVGEDVARTKCLCCGVNEIKMNNFHCGHVIAEAKGGKPTVDNLRPICKACNLSMGTEDLFEFRKKCGFGELSIPVIKEEPVFWSPGMFSSVSILPKYVKWQVGTNSIQMGADLKKFGYLNYNKETGLYSR